MSDIFRGEGWWMASDGKWYAPQLHHDPAYRAKYASVAEPAVESGEPAETSAESGTEGIHVDLGEAGETRQDAKEPDAHVDSGGDVPALAPVPADNRRDHKSGR